MNKNQFWTLCFYKDDQWHLVTSDGIWMPIFTDLEKAEAAAREATFREDIPFVPVTLSSISPIEKPAKTPKQKALSRKKKLNR